MKEKLISRLTDFALTTGQDKEEAADIMKIVEALKMGKKIWIARDKDAETLGAFMKKPLRVAEFESSDSEEKYWDDMTGWSLELPASLCPDLKWEDGPKEIIIVALEV